MKETGLLLVNYEDKGLVDECIGDDVAKQLFGINRLYQQSFEGKEEYTFKMTSDVQPIESIVPFDGSEYDYFDYNADFYQVVLNQKQLEEAVTHHHCCHSEYMSIDLSQSSPNIKYPEAVQHYVDHYLFAPFNVITLSADKRERDIKQISDQIDFKKSLLGDKQTQCTFFVPKRLLCVVEYY